MKHPRKSSTRSIPAHGLPARPRTTALLSVGLCHLLALSVWAAPTARVKWEPSLGFAAKDHKPFPAKSVPVSGYPDGSSLITGSDLDVVGLTNDSSGNWVFEFGNVPSSIDGSRYLLFSLTPSSGYQAELSGLYLSTDRYHATPTDYVLRTSQDGFGSDIVGEHWFGPNTQNYAGVRFDLSGLSKLTSPTTFHLHLSDSSDNDGSLPIYNSIHTLGHGLWFNNITVTPYTGSSTTGDGRVTVPTPGAALLVGIGLTALAKRKRRPSSH